MNTMYTQIKVNVVSHSVFNFGCNFPPLIFSILFLFVSGSVLVGEVNQVYQC
jgi:hypothetical protein